MRPGTSGSTRLIHAAATPGDIDMIYTEKWSAFDRGSSPQLIPGIGAARCACAVKSFELAAAAGLSTHFVEQISDVGIRVREFSVPNHEPLSDKVVYGRVLPLEWIWRTHVKGSLLKRIREKKVDPTTLGFEAGVEIVDGMKLPRIVLECTTKFEKVDRHLDNNEAMELAGLSFAQWVEAWGFVEDLVGTSSQGYEFAGFDTPDGKLEIAMTHGGKFVGVDVWGTPDENRIIDKKTGDLYSKDLIRVYLETLPWKAELDAAKAAFPNDKSRWPPYPELPESIVELVASRYAQVAKRYAGVDIKI